MVQETIYIIKATSTITINCAFKQSLECTDNSQYFPMWFWILGWFFVALAVVGNGVVIYLIFTAPRLQTNTNWFVLSLAVADLCAALAFFPPLFGANFFFTIDTTHTGAFFKISRTLMYCSNTNLFAMTLDRYIAITRPLRYIALMTREAIWGLIATAWVAPFLLFCLPAIFTYQENPSYTIVVETSRVVIFQVFPLFVFIGVTCQLLHLARKRAREMRDLVAQVRFNHPSEEVNIPDSPAPQSIDKKGTTIMVLLIITAFNITYLGGNYRCICLVTKMCPVPDTLTRIVYLTLIANSAVSPIVYAFVKRDIRKELRKTLKLPDK